MPDLILQDLPSWKDRDFLNMLGDVEDDFCASNPEARKFLTLCLSSELG